MTATTAARVWLRSWRERERRAWMSCRLKQRSKMQRAVLAFIRDQLSGMSQSTLGTTHARRGSAEMKEMPRSEARRMKTSVRSTFGAGWRDESVTATFATMRISQELLAPGGEGLG